MSSFEISCEQLKAELADSSRKLLLLDVREPEEFEESHLPGCKLIPLGELDERASELDPAADIVVYCAHGMRSLNGLMILKQRGFEKVRSLEGGICAWEELYGASPATR